MDQEKLMRRLVGIFLEELEEHRANLEHGILTLEAQVRGHTATDNAQTPASRREVIEALFRAAHSLKGAAQSVGATEVAVLCHELEQAFHDLSTGVSTLSVARVGLWLASLDRLGLAATRLRQRYGGEGQVETQPKAREPERVIPREAAFAPHEKPAEPAPPEPAQTAIRAAVPTGAIVRVSSAKLDALLADVDELSTASSKLEHSVQGMGDLRELSRALVSALRFETAERGALRGGGTSDLVALVEKATALDAEIQRLEGKARDDVYELKQLARRADNHVRRTRMVPFSAVCEGFERVVRDLGQVVDKDLLLTIENEDVEVDRAVAQRLKDPLLHLLRNAATHGIESRAQRAAAHKPVQGRLSIVASLQGNELEVVVADDGQGLDLVGLEARAKSLGFPVPTDDQEVLQLVFAPGLSTADRVTEVAGRGVGLNAVRRSIESMHGSVTVTSQVGAFARFTLRVPVLVSTLRCLFASVAGQVYAIPCSQIVRILNLKAEDLFLLDGVQVVRVEGAAVPVIALAAALGEGESQAPERVPVLVVSGDGKHVAFVVDKVLAEGESLLRALPARLHGIKNLSGVTTLPSGKSALVIHTGDLCREALRLTHSGGVRIALHTLASPPRLLVVDDSLTTRTLLKSILEEGGYDVTTAQDGNDAWKMLQEQVFALVVSDVQMPNMDGLTLTATIRASSRLARLPVILVTALGSETERQRGLDVGATAYLNKTAFDQSALLQAVASHV